MVRNAYTFTGKCIHFRKDFFYYFSLGFLSFYNKYRGVVARLCSQVVFFFFFLSSRKIDFAKQITFFLK